MKYYYITEEKIKVFVSELLNKDNNVVCPLKNGNGYERINSYDELNIDSFAPPSAISMKELFFPRSEILFYYKKNKGNVELADVDIPGKHTVIIGAKPCDTAAVMVLKKVFNWDYHDDFFNNRVENSIIIGMQCSYGDAFCFCTSVGLSPDSLEGSDIFMYKVNEDFIITTVTEKGEEFLKRFPYLQENEADDFKPAGGKNIPANKFDYSIVKEWLDKNFSNEFWKEAGELCLGCAQCAFVCPACHCFDIEDEECGLNCGKRVKNWDACQFGLFTKHASGHNPRDNQGKRYRQRVLHKFKYYMDRFNEILCTGCGRCTRGCPAGINIADILARINSFR